MDMEVAKIRNISLSKLYLGFVQMKWKYSNYPKSDLV